MAKETTEISQAGASDGEGQAHSPVRGTPPHRAAALGLVGTGFSTVANIVSTFVIPRMLGPATYGAFSLFVSFRETVVSISQVGMSGALARYVGVLENRPEWPRVLGTVFALQAGIALVLVCGATPLLSASLGDWSTPAVMVLAVLQMMLGSVLGFLVSLAYGRNMIGAVTVVSAVGAVSGVLLIPPLFALLGFVGAVAAGLFGEAITWWILWKLTRPWGIKRPGRDALGQAGAILLFGVQVFFGGLIWLVFTRGGNFVLAATGQPMEEIGVFAAGFNPMIKLVRILGSLFSSLLPGLVGLLSANRMAKALVWTSAQARYTAALAVVCGAAMGFVGVPLLVVVLGRKYAGVQAIASVSMVALVPLAFDGLARSIAVAWGHARLNIETFVLVAALFVAVGLWLTPGHGAMGLVVALVLASAGAAAYGNARLRLWTGVWPLGWTWLLAMALGAPAAISFLVDLSWPLRLVGLGGFCCYYAVALVLLRITPLDEIQDFWRNLRQRRVEEA